MYDVNRKQIIGQRIEAERQRQGMDREPLAAAAGISARTLYNLINGRWSKVPPSLKAVCDALNMTEDELFADLPETDPESKLPDNYRELVIRAVMQWRQETIWAMVTVGNWIEDPKRAEDFQANINHVYSLTVGNGR